MMPNMDPRTMRNLMAKMGIKSTEVPASRVVIESEGKNIVITSPQVTRIEAQGVSSFQISGEISEEQAKVELEITEDDIETVASSTGIDDKEKIAEALKEENGDIARAILRLKKEPT
jgi:nascent polypeptide-associated complex subunit alpha